MLVLKKLNYHNILQFLKEKWNTYLNETCQPYKSGNAMQKPKREPLKKRQKERQKNFEKGLLKSFFLVMFVGDDLNCSFFFYKPMKLSNKMNIKHNSTIENRATEKTYSRLKFGRRASCFLALGFLALGFLTTGFFALNLQAQDAEDPRKKGFFVGVAPYTMGVTLEKEVKIAEVNDVVIDSVEYDATFGPDLEETFRTNNNYWIAARVFVIALCKGNYTLIESPTGTLANGATGDVFIPITEDLQGFEHGVRDLLGILNIRQFIAGGDIDFDNYPDETGDISYATEAQRIANAPRCKAHFDSQRLSSTRAPGTAEKTEEQMSGTGIAFGYNLEKWGLSFSHYNLGAGDNKLQSQVLLADYFLPYGFSVGVGFASMKLDTSIGTISKTARYCLGLTYHKSSISKRI